MVITVLNEYLLDETLAFYIDLDRLSNTASKQAIDLLRKMQLELLGYLSSADLTDQYGGAARIKQQLAEANAVINRYYQQIGQQNQADLSEISKVTATETAQALATATGQQITAGLLPTNAVLETIANEAIVLGAPLKDWWSKQAVDTSLKYQSAIRQGIVNGETIGQIISRVKQNFEVTDRNAETLVRTSFISVSNTAREQTYQENSDIIKGIEWVAALDFRTCPRCAERDNKRWTLDHKPIDSSIPYESLPLHPNCRCAYIAVVKTPEELGINVGALPERLRASATGMTEDKSFPDWLKRQPKAKVEEQFGKGRAELWLSGKVTFDQLFKNGNPLTLEQLKAKYTN